MVIARMSHFFQARSKSVLHFLAVLLSLRQVGASPTQSQAQVARPRTAPNSAAAVPLPIHLGASAGSPGVYVPVQLVGGLQGTPSSAAGNLWTWAGASEKLVSENISRQHWIFRATMRVGPRSWQLQELLGMERDRATSRGNRGRLGAARTWCRI